MLPKNLLFIFLLLFSVALQAQSDRITFHKALIVCDTLSPDEVLIKMKNHEKWGHETISAAEWEQIKNILLAKNTNSPSVRDQYFMCYADCNKYAVLKEIGNALYCIDSFYKKVKALNDDEQLMNVYQLFITTYEQSNMIDDALKYARLQYALKCKNKSHAEIMELSNAFVWMFYKYGREKNDTALIQEAQIMGEKRISYFEEHPSDQSGIGDDYKINIMASLRLKNWMKAIEISKRALKTFGLVYTSTDEGYLNYRRKLFSYQAVAYARLQNRDSALYYINHPIMYQNSATDRNVFMPDQKRFLDVEELMECINVYFILNEHKKAADLAYRAIYSPYKLKQTDNREFMKSYFAKVFLAAGMYKEAAEGFKLMAQNTDSTSREEITLLNEKQIISNRLEIANINEINEKREEIAQKTLERQILVRNVFIGGFALLLIFSGVFFVQRNKIRKGKKLSDELLLNILPYSIAEELKSKGNAESKLIDDVTVLFTDFKGFTELSDRFTPQELVAEINECFSAFDQIMFRHNVEKIKTIGDAYMAAGGLPTSNTTHAEDVIKAALEIQQYMSDYKKAREDAGKLFFEIRIGVHSGPVVAGIVGIKKFAYDIWGDTVNTASRMESSGEVGKVNVSESTYTLTQNKFNFTYRGKIAAKGKGEISMYFVEPKTQSEFALL
jgi:class 3 adenylate cyclase